ncbi:hypothetical protein BDV97DRAFT_51914 [Delphinella strobiligena]|nr:hypothetical protein BDV97DRAFT_51914 [Delphinella strobiligena]
MEKVFDESNLLEMILLEVPAIDVLVNAQRVCKAFKGTADESLPIQRQLFFRPEAAPLAYETAVGMFIAEYKPPDEDGLHAPVGVVKCAETGTDLVMNPFVHALWPAPNPYTSLQSWFLEFPGYFSHQGSRYNELVPRHWINSPPKVLEVKFFLDEYPSPSNVRGIRRHGVAFPKASWRRMLLTQPPVSGAACTSCATEEEKSELVVKSGLTLGDMLEEKRRRENPEEDKNHKHWGDCNRFIVDLGPLEVQVLETSIEEEDEAVDTAE